MVLTLFLYQQFAYTTQRLSAPLFSLMQKADFLITRLIVNAASNST